MLGLRASVLRSGGAMVVGQRGRVKDVMIGAAVVVVWVQRGKGRGGGGGRGTDAEDTPWQDVPARKGKGRYQGEEERTVKKSTGGSGHVHCKEKR
ncbi:hypothetical protein L1987_47010 [Smallanthus sonchifolius]|uniref:Uncharacterized protein n=1 Tax=Smallanthus sonchifolius TaxID=185202 RepID=A0ACB9G2E1_9ASTR|nr:hypothetical protein L1987_47010 [Smallanthus sonchifolius]